MVRPGRKPEFHSLFFIALVFFLSSCGGDGAEKPKTQSTSSKPSVQVPVFNADSAYAYVKQQVEFGPRVPNTAAHQQCGDWFVNRLSEWADTVMVQSFQVRAFDGKMLNGRNIVAAFHPELGNRIMLFAHWDTRPFADMDDADKNKPIQGANDGGSGVGVLMEVARQINLNDPGIGIDIILFDVEDYGQPDDSPLPRMEDSYCLGSQYWSNTPHVRNYTAQYGILLDMVGGRQLRFTQEGTSMQYAPYVVDKVWKVAAATGFGEYFLFERTKPIIDDHYYVNRIARIPSIDLIHYDHSTDSKFWKHWHTQDDSMENIDANSLRVSGQVLLELLYREAAGI